MKVLLVNGSPRQHGCTYTALTEAANALNERGIETEIVWVGNKEIAGCTACGGCRKTGKCIFDDMVNEISAKLDTYDGFIFGTPVYYHDKSSKGANEYLEVAKELMERI